jgi:nicotinate dehydrogenase subunit A
MDAGTIADFNAPRSDEGKSVPKATVSPRRYRPPMPGRFRPNAGFHHGKAGLLSADRSSAKRAGTSVHGLDAPSDGLIKRQGKQAIMAQKFTLNVNGKDHLVDADPDMPLLYALRNDVGLNNPHFGCGLAQCGACTVHLDGQAIRSCVTPVSAVGNGKVVTLAGLGTPEKPHPLQTAYVEEQVPQCGYCINGWIMTAAAFLRDKKKPSEAEIKTALEGLKCRCGTHMGILRAVKRAAEMMG